MSTFRKMQRCVRMKVAQGKEDDENRCNGNNQDDENSDLVSDNEQCV